MVTLEEIQSAYYMVAATGVLVAAIYYIMNLRNVEREKRRQTILQRLPSYNKELPDAFYYLRSIDICKDYTEWYNKYAKNPDNVSKLFYVLGYYNTVGILYQEKLLSLEDISQQYGLAVIDMFERFWWVIPNNRLDEYGENVRPWFYKPLENLYRDLKRRDKYTAPISADSKEEDNKRRLKEENVWSKLSKEEFLNSVVK